MYKFSRGNKVDADVYKAHLKKNGKIYYDRNATELQKNYMECTAGAEKVRATEVMFNHSGGRIVQLNRDSIYNFLVNYERCPDHYFYANAKSKSFSLDKKKVLSKLLANGYAQEFLDHYNAHRSLQQKAGDVNSILSTCSHVTAQTRDGRDLCEIPYDVNQQKNERFNYRQFDIIAQIPKEFCHNICAPAGYFLAWGDFAQSDFRIAYNLLLRSEENDRVMSAYSDKYEALARLIAESNNEQFDEEKFRKERDLYKQLTLATMYGTRDSVVSQEREFIRKLVKFLYTCPKYVEYEKRLHARQTLGLPIIVESYFGYEETIAIQCNNPAGTINDALNSPIQSGTSEIIILTVNQILEEFFKLGCTEDDVSVYYVRHDEPIFLIKESIMKDVWVLNQFSQILVDDWIPLNLNFEFGYAYKVKDPGLERSVREVYMLNLNKISVIQHGSKIDEDYYPVKCVFTLFMHYVHVGSGKTVAAFVHEESNSYYAMLIESDDETEIQNAIRILLSESESRIRASGYNGVCVISNFIDGEDFFGQSYFRYKTEVSVRLNCVSKVCRAFTNKYCASLGIESPVAMPDENEMEKIKSMGVLKELTE